MKKFCCILPLLLLLLAGCKNKKTSLTDGEQVTIQDFIEFFPESKLPVRIADTSLLRKITPPDTATIGNKVFSQFIPDSLVGADFGKSAKPKIYPIGRVKEKGKETYLFVKAIAGAKRAAYLLCFSDDDQYLGGMPLVKTGFDDNTSAYGMLDAKFQITTYREKRQGANLSFKKNVYFYNSNNKEFTLVFTEPNVEMIKDVFNPIDTLPAKHKFAGDYVRNKTNLISVRDGKSASEVQIFIHFEKSDGCRGELKGVARFVSANTAVYGESGNPCELQLIFSKSQVTMKETGGCGSYRDIKCFFEGSFPKKKTADPKKKK